MFSRLGQRRTTLILLVLASITLITFNVRGNGIIDGARATSLDAFAPVRSAAGTVFSPFENVWHGVFDYERVKRERDDALEQVDAQAGAAIAAEAQVRDYQELRQRLGLSTASGIPRVTAQVVGLPPSNFQLTVEIDQGGNRGIRVGMPVINGAGLVGRIAEVTPNRSVVRLVTDPEINIGVKIIGIAAPTTIDTTTTAPAETTTTEAPATTAARRGATTAATEPPTTTTTVPPTTTTVPLTELDRGILSGQGRGKDLTVDMIDAERSVDVKVGDSVVTSGVDTSLAPGDIPVGRVSSAQTRPGSLELDVQVTPAADLERLNFVEVLLYAPAK